MNGLRLFVMAALVVSCTAAASSAPPTRDGGEILQRFHAGLADPRCDDASTRWKHHYAHAASRLADDDEIALALFGYVLDEVRNAGLPAELALIPFVESRYRADARSPFGQVGLWQFTAATARRQGMHVRGGIDERLSIPLATTAAVRYLVRLHRMFGRQWTQTAMAYNAGEGALKASRRRNGRPLSGITRSYPGKLHAIACLFDQHGRHARWQRAVERPVLRLAARQVPAGTRSLRAWALARGLDPGLVAVLNPGWHAGVRVVLAPVAATHAGPARAAEAN